MRPALQTLRNNLILSLHMKIGSLNNHHSLGISVLISSLGKISDYAHVDLSILLAVDAAALEAGGLKATT